MRPWLVLVVALVGSPAAAQSLTGVLAGTIRDAQGVPLPGATLTLTGKAGSTASPTDAQGNYRFPAVEPGRYQLRAEAPGFRPREQRDLVISIGERLAFDFALALAPLQESVEVETPVVDVNSSATRNGLAQGLLFQVPFARFVPGLISATPGINGASRFGAAPIDQGAAAFGGSEVGNALLVDGVETRDPGQQGKWLSIGYNTLDEVQVLGPGAPAEYGAFTGAVFNAIRRSGGNRFEGLFEARASGRALSADNAVREVVEENPALAEPSVVTSLLDLTAQVGGPIQKDRLFFYLSAQHSREASDPLGARTRSVARDIRADAKLTWQPGPADHLSAGVYYNGSRTTGVAGYADALATDQATSTQEKPDWSWNASWRHVLGPRTLVEAKYAGWSARLDLEPTAFGPLRFNADTGAQSGAAGFTFVYDPRRHQANVALSHHADHFVGSHDFKFGLEIERSASRDAFALVGGYGYLDLAGAPYLAYSYGYDVSARTRRESVYAQDAWSPRERLTVNAGVRLDNDRGLGTGSETIYQARGLAPRLGVAFDVTGDHRSVAKASYARYYEGLPQDSFRPALPGYQDLVLYLNTGEGLIPINRVLLSNPARVDPDIRQPHVDEFSAGFDRALGHGVRVSLTGIWRRSDDITGIVLQDARFVPVTIVNPITGAPLTVYGWTNPRLAAADRLITNPDGFAYRDGDGNLIGTADAFRRYRGLLLVFTRRFEGRWQAQASYVLSRAEGTLDNTYADSLMPGPFRLANEALVNPEGLLTHDARHEVKLLGSYQVPKVEIVVSGFFRAVSGARYTPYLEIPEVPAPFPESVRLERRGSRGLPTQVLLDLRLEKAFRLHAGRLGVYMDVTNLLNAHTATTVQDRFPEISIAGFDQPVAFGAPTAIVPARQAILGARFSF